MKHSASHRNTCCLYYLYTFKPCKNKIFDIVYSPGFSSKKKKKYGNSICCIAKYVYDRKTVFIPLMIGRTFCRLASGSVLFRPFLFHSLHNSVLLSIHMFLLSHDLWSLYLVSWPYGLVLWVVGVFLEAILTWCS